MTIVALALAAALTALPKPIVSETLAVYSPYSRDAETSLGMLHLSQHQARFSKLHGTLRLKPAGRRPPTANEEAFAETLELFEVTNVETFHKANHGVDKPCSQAVRWLSVQRSGLQLIRVGFLSAPSQLCASASYLES
jgi:hypothetical protein